MRMLLIVLFTILTGGVNVVDRVMAADVEPDSLITTLMAVENLPSISVAVGKGGVILYTKAIGSADVEGGTPATPNTVYRVGSIAKTLTATAVMQLTERGQLNLDGPVQAYCDSFPDRHSAVTPRLLLAHLGGIRDYNYRRFNEEFLSAVHYQSVTEALSVFKNDSLIAPPGEKYQYSSFGYVLLGCVIEGATGVTFAEYVRTNILKPAGMEQTRLDVHDEIVPHRARPYSRSREGVLMNSPFVDLSDRYPAGGFLSTPSDLVRFGMAFANGNLVSKESISAMTTPQVNRSGEAIEYGLGWRLSDHAGEIFHGGSSVGGSSYLYIDLASGVVVAFATNVDRWSESRHELALALAEWAKSQ